LLVIAIKPPQKLMKPSLSVPKEEVDHSLGTLMELLFKARLPVY
jgi:hypothetical protein